MTDIKIQDMKQAQKRQAFEAVEYTEYRFSIRTVYSHAK